VVFLLHCVLGTLRVFFLFAIIVSGITLFFIASMRSPRMVPQGGGIYFFHPINTVILKKNEPQSRRRKREKDVQTKNLFGLFGFAVCFFLNSCDSAGISGQKMERGGDFPLLPHTLYPIPHTLLQGGVYSKKESRVYLMNYHEN
jgi:hypothetical protein